MKISLQLLLGIVLLAALGVNAFLNFQTSDAIRANCERLDDSLAKIREKNQYSEERKLVYQRAFDGFKHRKESLLNAPEFFESVAHMHGKVEVKPDQIRVLSISGAEHENFLHQRFRISLPESPQFELWLGYHETDSKSKLPLKLRNSDYFVPEELVTIPLKKRESLVEFKIPYEESATKINHVVEVIVNGQIVHQATRSAMIQFWKLGRKKPKNWPRKIVSVLESEEQLFAAETLSLVTVHAWPTGRPESVSLMLRPIDGEKK